MAKKAGLGIIARALLGTGLGALIAATAGACGAGHEDGFEWEATDEAEGALGGVGEVSGELKLWHKITVTFTGPTVSEGDATNPFRDYRLDVTFANGSRSVTVPGYYAADGNAAESGASSGARWRAHFTPDAVGTWTYAASFRAGTDVAVSLDPAAGTAAGFDGASGSFTVGPSDKTGRDHRGKGLLRYTGDRYLQFAGTGERFLKGGADSPENFLAYHEFDQTPTTKHTYAPHLGDYQAGDPSWQGGKGKAIIGALNYLASEEMNSSYFLTMNVNGDGNDVWPWTSSAERYRFDVSKLDQWEIVFSHMDRLGIALHVVTQETENDQLLDGGALGIQRKLYYRELVARFGHHLALTWNLGEENTNTDAQRKAFADHLRALDPYDHPIVVHTYPGQDETVYPPLLGHPTLEGPSLQIGSLDPIHAETIQWIDASADSGRKWVVNLDEIGPAGTGVMPDANDPTHDSVRNKALWGNLMAGGGGVEWYFGYSYPHDDLDCEDWRSRDAMWNQTRHALAFFRQHLPFWQMSHADALTSSTSDYCLAKPEEAYAIYLPAGGSTNLDLGASTGTFSVQWYNPRAGGALQSGSVASVTGPGVVSIGNPPVDPTKDWVALVKLSGAPAGQAVTSFSLINADNDQPISSFDPLPSGAVLNLATLPTRNLNVRANTSPGIVGSVRFGLDASASYATESAAPYALAGDTSGNYHAWTPALGAHTLTGTPFASANAGGAAGTALSIGFSVVDSAPPTVALTGPANGANFVAPATITLAATASDSDGTVTQVAFYQGSTLLGIDTTSPYSFTWSSVPAGSYTLTARATDNSGAIADSTPVAVTVSGSGQALTSFTLINADNDQPISSFDPIPAGAVINLAALPTTNLNIRANTSPATVGSVRFALDGNANFRTESGAPYALAGDTSGDYFAWTPATGSHTLTGTPYSAASAGGTPGAPLTLNFQVVSN